MIIITENNFVWMDITKRMSSAVDKKALWDAHEIYAIYPRDESDHLIENIDMINKYIENGYIIAIEVGPIKGTIKWKPEQQKIIKGRWFTPISRAEIKIKTKK